MATYPPHGVAGWDVLLKTWLNSFVNDDGSLKQAPIQTALGGSLSSLGWLSVKETAYGAKGDVVTGALPNDGAIGSGSAVFTSATAAFTSADVGKVFGVVGAGAAGAVLATTIASYQSATQVTLTATASTTVTNASFLYGTDDTTAIQAAITAASALGITTVYFPNAIYLAAGLTLPSNMRLVGEGVGSQLRLKPGAADHLLKLGSVSAEKYGVSDMWLHGGYTMQTSALDCIHIDQTAGSGFQFNDSMPWFERLLITYASGVGLSLGLGSRSAKCSDIEIRNCQVNNLRIDGTDHYLTNIVGGSSGCEGFYVTGANNHFANCKSFGSGTVTAARGDGWYITAARTDLAACEAQDNQRHGFNFLNSSRSVCAAFYTDSNGVSGTGSGLTLDGSSGGVYTGVSQDRGGSPTQQYGVNLANSSDYNIIEVNCRNNLTASLNGAVLNNRLKVGDNAAAWTDTSQARNSVRLTARSLLVENYPSANHGSAATVLVDGSVYFMLIGLIGGDVVTNLVVNVGTASGGATHCYVGLYDLTGARLALSADLTNAWATTGYKQNALTAPYTVTRTGGFFVALLSTGGTMPTIARAGTNGAVAGVIGSGAIQFGVPSTGQSALPSSVTPATGAAPIEFWVGAS